MHGHFLTDTASPVPVKAVSLCVWHSFSRQTSLVIGRSNTYGGVKKQAHNRGSQQKPFTGQNRPGLGAHLHYAHATGKHPAERDIYGARMHRAMYQAGRRTVYCMHRVIGTYSAHSPRSRSLGLFTSPMKSKRRRPTQIEYCHDTTSDVPTGKRDVPMGTCAIRRSSVGSGFSLYVRASLSSSHGSLASKGIAMA